MTDGYNYLDQYGSIHLTYCFNTAILMQLFHMLTCFNLLSRKSVINAFKDHDFLKFWILSLILHFVVITFGTRMFRCSLWVKLKKLASIFNFTIGMQSNRMADMPWLCYTQHHSKNIDLLRQNKLDLLSSLFLTIKEKIPPR